MVPCNVIPDEIIGDHPERFRAMLIESGNPVHSLADSQRMCQALRALELVVVIDVALTETARQADYVLPAASQYEKWECTFFNLEFPRNVYHLRRPIFEPLAGTLPEYEIHSRLCRALGAYNDADLVPLREAAAVGRAAFAEAFINVSVEHPKLAKLAAVLPTRRSARRCRLPTASMRGARPRCGAWLSGARWATPIRSGAPTSATTRRSASATHCSTRSSPRRVA